jgi:hypothetical protein
MNIDSLRLDRTKFTFNYGMTDEELQAEADAEVLADEEDEETRQVQMEDEFSAQELAEMVHG